jgi:hypothetical protein
MKKPFSSFISILLVILPVIVTLLWHLNNQGWPNDDAADYMKTAYQQYLAFHNGSPFEGLGSLYQIRGWRPILFPVLATPFLLLLKGNILAATGATLIVCFVVCQIYIYAISKRYLDTFRASLVAAFVGTSSASIFSSMVFFSEIAWLAFFTGFVFHLLKSELFRDRFQATIAGIFLGLSILVRPMETIAVAVLSLIGMLVIALNEKIFFFNSAVQIIGFVILNTCLLIASIFINRVDYSVVLVIGFIVILLQLIIIKNKKYEPGIFGLNLFAVSFMAINLFWWADSMTQLFQWTSYSTVFGPMIKAAVVYMKKEDFSSIIKQIFSLYSLPHFIMAAVTTCLILLQPNPKQNPGNIKRLYTLIIITLGSLLPIFVLYSFANSCESRRIFIGMSFLLMLLAILSLQDGPWRRVRDWGITLFVIIQFAGLLWSVEGEFLPLRLPLLKRYYASFTPRTKADQNEAVILRLLELGIPKNSSVAVYTMAIFQFRDRIYEPAALSLAALTTGSNIKIIYFFETGEYSTVIKRLRENDVSFLLIDVYKDTENKSSHQPLIHFASALLKKMQGPYVDPPGLQRMATFKIGGRDQVLFRVLPSD